MGMQTSDQSSEIERLNSKYRQALKEKVALYEDLSESAKELVVRDARWFIR